MEQTSMKNMTNDQKEVRLKDRHGHFLGKIVNVKIYVYCKRCKEFLEVVPEGGEEAKHTD